MGGTALNLVRIIGLSVLLVPPAAAQAPQPNGPSVDRVGLPVYAQGFTLLRRFHGAQQNRVGLVYANAAAASVTDLGSLPYPHGAIFLVEWRPALTDSAGAAVRDADGQVRAGDEIVQIDVMRRERGFGEAYGAARNGEWEFASYRPDGTHATAPEGTGQCAACHQAAGPGRDFVFRGRFGPISTMRMTGN